MPTDTPLHKAANSGDDYEVRSLVRGSDGIDVNALGASDRTPLHRAAGSGHVKVVKLLIELGADVKLQDTSGRTPLHWAVLGGHEAVVDVLIEAGADVNAKMSNGWTPLHCIVSAPDSAFRRAPVSKAGVKDAGGKKKADPTGRQVLVATLLRHGADSSLTDLNGNTPAAMSKHLKDKALTKLLKPPGTNTSAWGSLSGVFSSNKSTTSSAAASSSVKGKEPAVPPPADAKGKGKDKGKAAVSAGASSLSSGSTTKDVRADGRGGSLRSGTTSASATATAGGGRRRHSRNLAPAPAPQPEKATARQRIMHYYLGMSQGIDGGIASTFGKLGHCVAMYPWLVIILSLVLVTIAGFGMERIVQDNRAEVVWVGASETTDNRDFLDDVYGAVPDQQTFLITHKDRESNILTTPVLDELLELHDRILNGITARLDGKDIRLGDLCVRRPDNGTIPGECAFLSVLDYYDYQPGGTPPITLAQQTNTLSYQQTPFAPETVVGGIVRDLGMQITAASAFRMTYLVQVPEEDVDKQIKWEQQVLEEINNEYFSENDLLVLPFTSFAIDFELQRSVTKDQGLVAVSLMLMILYVIYVMSRRDKVHSRIAVGLMGLVSVVMAIIAAYGVCGYLGVVQTSITIVIPFLLIGIGVDDMFIIIAALEATDPDRALPSRMREAMAHAGSSITITSFTSIIAFIIGALFASFPAVQYFCVYAAFSVFFDYVLQVTFFVACLVLDTQRVNRGQSDCLCCLTAPPVPPFEHRDHPAKHTPAELHESQTQGRLARRFFRNVYIPYYLRNSKVKLATMALFLAAFGVGIYGALQVDNNFEVSMIVPDDSFTLDVFDLSDEYFDLGSAFTLVTKSTSFRTEAERQQLRDLMDDLAASEYVVSDHPPAFSSWLIEFDNWVNATGAPVSTPMQFDASLAAFLASPFGASFTEDLVMDDDTGHILYTRQFGSHYSQPGSDELAALLIEVKGIVRDSPLDAFSYSVNYLFWEGFLSIVQEAVLNMTLAVAAVAVVSLLFLIHPTSAGIVTWTVIMIDVDLLGFMRLMDISINSISVVVLVMGVGLSIDYCAHMAHSFMTNKGTRQHRMEEAVVVMGSSVVNAALTTLLGLAPLAISTTEIFRIFFTMLVGIVGLSLLHGFIFMPAALSMFGPKSTDELRQQDAITVALMHPEAFGSRRRAGHNTGGSGVWAVDGASMRASRPKKNSSGGLAAILGSPSLGANSKDARRGARGGSKAMSSGSGGGSGDDSANLQPDYDFSSASKFDAALVAEFTSKPPSEEQAAVEAEDQDELFLQMSFHRNKPPSRRNSMSSLRRPKAAAAPAPRDGAAAAPVDVPPVPDDADAAAAAAELARAKEEEHLAAIRAAQTKELELEQAKAAAARLTEQAKAAEAAAAAQAEQEEVKTRVQLEADKRRAAAEEARKRADAEKAERDAQREARYKAQKAEQEAAAARAREEDERRREAGLRGMLEQRKEEEAAKAKAEKDAELAAMAVLRPTPEAAVPEHADAKLINPSRRRSSAGSRKSRSSKDKSASSKGSRRSHRRRSSSKGSGKGGASGEARVGRKERPRSLPPVNSRHEPTPLLSSIWNALTSKGKEAIVDVEPHEKPEIAPAPAAPAVPGDAEAAAAAPVAIKSAEEIAAEVRAEQERAEAEAKAAAAFQPEADLVVDDLSFLENDPDFKKGYQEEKSKP